MPITLNDLKREIAKFEEEWGLVPDLYERELVVNEQRITGLNLVLLQDGSSDYIDLNLNPHRCTSNLKLK